MARSPLSADTTWHVAVTGNDSWAGDALNPWKDPQYATEKIQRDFDMLGYSPTLKFHDSPSWQVQSGLTTFCAGNGPCVGANGASVTLNFLGNLTTPSNCQITFAPGQYGFSFGNDFIGTVYGFQFNGPTNGSGAIPLFASNGGKGDFGNVIFNTNYQGVNVFAVDTGTWLMYGDNNAIIGNTFAQFAMQGTGHIKAAPNSPISVPNAIAFGQFVQATSQGRGDFTHASYSGAGVSGCTGQKANAYACSSITTNGNTGAFLGNSAAVADSTSKIA